MFRFLIVDDDAACRALTQAFLSPYGTCDMAYDGHEAIAAFRIALDGGRRYDLVCLDIMMPGLDGHKTLDTIRTMEQRRGIYGTDATKVIMATALADSKHCIRAFEEGCEVYITKPIDEQELLSHVRSLLGELPEPGPVSCTPAEPAVRPEPPRPPQVARASADAAPHAPPVQPRAAEAVVDPPRPRYLIVDDDAVCRGLMRDILSGYGRCDFAYDGAEAIDAVRLALEDNDHYALICLDIMMPGTSGHDALEAIRKLETAHGAFGARAARVIMTTALRDSRHCVRSFREGCESYITKPINQEKLLAKLHELGLLQPTG